MSGPRRTILVADDDQALREAIVDCLGEEVSWNLLQASNGTDALALGLSANPAVILLDQRMPGLTGAEVVRALREAGASVPIILMTASRDVRDLAAELGLHCFLGKPFSFEQLILLVTRALAGQC